MIGGLQPHPITVGAGAILRAEMGMHIHQPGQHGMSLQVDHRIALGRGRPAHHHLDDSPVLDHQSLLNRGAGRNTIDDTPGVDQGAGWGGGGEQGDGQQEQGERDEPQGTARASGVCGEDVEVAHDRKLLEQGRVWGPVGRRL